MQGAVGPELPRPLTQDPKRVTVKALPGSSLEVVEAELLFQLLMGSRIHRALMVAAKAPDEDVHELRQVRA
jgi:hypothetical protein